MIAAYIVLAAFVLIALAKTLRYYSDRVIAEVLAAEQRGIERERREQQYAANLAAKWVG
jgi:hypothetical protein